jgi:hypothetical protein
MSAIVMMLWRPKRRWRSVWTQIGELLFGQAQLGVDLSVKGEGNDGI